MELQEHLDENPELREWYEAMTSEMDRLAAAGYPHVVPGRTDMDAGITHGAYRDEVEELVTRRIYDTEDGKDVILDGIQSFDDWKREKRELVNEHIEFSRYECDLCRSTLGGGRHYVTALSADPSTNEDYVSYMVCDDCYLYVCNGDLPER